MRCLLIITMEPEIWESLSQEERDGVMAAHERFQREFVEPGELLSSVVLAGPSDTKAVRVRDGVRGRSPTARARRPRSSWPATT